MKRDYFIINNGRLSRERNTLFFEKYGEDGVSKGRKPIPIETVNTLYCFGENDYNSKFFNFLSENGIVLHQFNYYGYYSGSFYPREKLVAGELLVRQVTAYLDDAVRIELARHFIEAAAFHILGNLHDQSVNAPAIRSQIRAVEKLKERIDSCANVAKLMAIEAMIRKTYYECWDEFLNWDEPFEKRSKQPPQNSLNALISFGNSLLYTTVLAEIYQTQLNPTISYLHEPGVRRYSLSLDLAEIFKPVLVDPLIFRLINKKMLKLDDFDCKLKFCYLNDNGRKIFLQEWDATLQRTIKHRQLNRSVSYRRLIRLELYKLMKHLMGEKEYKPFHKWW
ncbi:MAG TPA: type I-B CRISPR-associated endonuclease Cas1 [Candidatus Marinimicrobia bacterium]|nr:type I-B CRISPR-associated endonuclease Cas1 [Candidatus Neomarinimicrobiota bacterium]